MNTETYEQVQLGKHLINAPEFLKDGLNCLVVFHADEERPISCDLPSHVELEITYTEPGVKGDTATNTLKPATVDTGAEVRVPLFIDTGDWIKVDTRTGEYAERVKK
jgi:elongation factor P